MDWGNWLFWSVVVWIAFNLIWIGAISDHVKPWVGAIIATLLAAAVFRFGPRIQEEEAEEEE
jgi:purine-cytosine permease-like protein